MVDLILRIIPGEWLAGIGIAAAALAATWFGGRKSAKSDTMIKTAEANVEAWEVRNEVDNRVAAERDARERLRDDWQR